MQTDFERVFQREDNQYLQPPEILDFQANVRAFSQRLAAYRSLRDSELALFQAIADRLVENFSEESPKLLERSLKHWISTLRYGAMAMLLNNPNYFQHRILEWLRGSMQAYDRPDIDRCLYQLLRGQLTSVLSSEQFQLLEPFLKQAENQLLTFHSGTSQELIGELA